MGGGKARKELCRQYLQKNYGHNPRCLIYLAYGL